MPKTKTLWKSMRSGLQSAHGKIEWKEGKWFKHTGEISICNAGFHASENIVDAMGYLSCEILAKVEVRGDSIIRDDKQVWSEMKIVKIYKWTKKDNIKLAIYAAKLVVDLYEKRYPGDKRPREAIQAAQTFIKSPTEENRQKCYLAAAAAKKRCHRYILRLLDAKD